ncbi:hypothetical protein [Halovenus halobia]|uniref:hypothetical protein n=1 Tax=Halovenus halobia TaxID=3396622 RepID=UPI003F5492F3
MATDNGEEPSLDALTEWSDGFSWIAYPDEKPHRASHALSTENGVWVVDPVDADELDNRLASLGTVTGVVVLQDRHTRDSAAVASRHDVSVYMPEWMTLGRKKRDGDAELLTDELPGTSYELHKLTDTDDWEEAILYSEPMDTLVVPEAVGTSSGFTPDGQPLGVHPVLETPPSQLSEWSADRILVGHGESIHEEGADHLSAALTAE